MVGDRAAEGQHRGRQHRFGRDDAAQRGEAAGVVARLDAVEHVAVDVLAGDDAYIALRKRRAQHRTLTRFEQETRDFVTRSQKETRAAEDEATYAEVNGAVSPADKWTVSGAVGRQWVSSDLDYTTWNLGAAYQLTSNLAVDVRYHDTDEHDFGDIYGSRAVASLKATF